MTLVIDFDGTICEHRFPEVGAPKEGVRDALVAFKNAGCEIVIHSCRTASYWERQNQAEQRMAIIEFMGEHDLPYDRICADDKPLATFYIDDRALTFSDNWQQIQDTVLRKPELLPTEPTDD